MSNEIHLAFAHPKERSEANESETVYDRISLRDHTVEVEIGAFQSESGHSTMPALTERTSGKMCKDGHRPVVVPSSRIIIPVGDRKRRNRGCG